MSLTTEPPRVKLLRTVAPGTEPVSVADAKKQLEIASDDTAHDDYITDAIIAAREQVEQDTPYACISQTFEAILDQFPSGTDPIPLPIRPITSLVSVTYMDETTQNTLATSTADLDHRKRNLVLQYDKEWPSVPTQADGIVITIVAGFASQSTIPRLLRQAVLLQVAKWFEDRDMMFMQSHENFDVAYERIIRRLMRATYP